MLKQDIVITLICAVWIIIIPDFTQTIHFKKESAYFNTLLYINGNYEGLNNYSVTKCRTAVCSCMYRHSYQHVSLQFHCLVCENEYTVKILEMLGIHLRRGILLSKIWVFIFGTKTDSYRPLFCPNAGADTAQV